MQRPWVFLESKGREHRDVDSTQELGRLHLVVLPQKPIAVIFDSGFTSCCLLKIPRHETPAPTVFFHGTMLQAGHSKAVMSHIQVPVTHWGCWAQGLEHAHRGKQVGTGSPSPAH